MEKLLQEYILSIIFSESINREELLIEKYKHYYSEIKDAKLKELIKDLESDSKEHIKLVKDKMIKLNIQG